VFYPVQNGGGWPSWILKEIHEKLEKLNWAWDQTINKEFSS
jgi:hypothetical protein